LQQHKKAENMSDLAFQSGYYDQAHMTNEYKEFSGLSPKQYFCGCDAVSDYF
jgi:AraC-like DNA-binding protein